MSNNSSEQGDYKGCYCGAVLVETGFCLRCATKPGQNLVSDQYKTMRVDALAQEIRRVDGKHDLGAGALAEVLLPFIENELPKYPKNSQELLTIEESLRFNLDHERERNKDLSRKLRILREELGKLLSSNQIQEIEET